jgi:cytochrome c553
VTAKKNVAADFQKNSVHPIMVSSQAHSPTEDPVNPNTRHVVCADCHDPHATRALAAVAPNASGALANLTGVSAAGGVIKPLQREYELCFRCHADSVARGPATVPRLSPQTNTRLQFSVANQSFHPVESVGKNRGNVPSLIAPWTVNSVMYCTDCHNSDSSPNAGGTGANGPHGSIFAPILERNLAVADYQPESPATYGLCYKCHDRNRVLSNLSFRFHNSHVVQDKAACTTCHDSHGVANAPHLINFNPLYVKTGSLGIVSYVSTGTFKGNCTLTCHGKDHKNTGY